MPIESNKNMRAILREKLEYVNPTTLHKVPEWDRIVKVDVPIETFASSIHLEDEELESLSRLSKYHGSGGKRMF